MATLRVCVTATKLFKKSLKPCYMYTAIRTNWAPAFTDESVDIFRELNKRKKEAGPEKQHHRNTFLEWNYQAELSAFSKRVGEVFMNNTLERAFTQRSYVLKQEALQKELGLEDTENEDALAAKEDNTAFAEKGEAFTRDFVARYLRTALPYLPEEGIQSIRNHVLSEQNLADIVSKIGADELILCTDFPTEIQTRVSTFYALVEAVRLSSGEERSALFVRDFVIASLSGQDIQSLVMPEDKFGLVKKIFSEEGKELEPRIIAQCGVQTIIASYRVGLFSDKKHIGSGDGESVEEAVDNASLTVLWKLWGIPDGKFLFPYHLDVLAALTNSQTNLPESEWTKDKAQAMAKATVISR